MSQITKYNGSLILVVVILFVAIACKKEQPAPLPVANFYVSNNGCIAPCKLYFFDQSKNVTSWEWDFGNGFNSLLQNDSSHYNLQGFYDVTLHVWNIDGAKDSISKQVLIH